VSVVFPGSAAAARISHYRIERELGRGGQAVVYLARDERLDRRVALKVLRESGPATGAALRRFRREVRVASRLRHPGICPVYDAGREEDVRWIAMPVLEGETLAARLRRTIEMPSGDRCVRLEDGARPEGRAGVRRAVHLAEQVARALHAAHEAGVVHRDVKPSNLMVTRDGGPVLMDFGVARDEEAWARVTWTGELLGTPSYMSPEQVQGGRLDRRTDVWSLAVTLFETLTLRCPFQATSREGLCEAILTREPPDPRRLNPLVSRDLAAVLRAALDKDPDRRYQTALDFADDLCRVREGRPIRARPAGPALRLSRWARRNPVVAGGLAAVVLLLAGGLAVSLGALQRTRASLLEERDALERATAARDRAVRLEGDARAALADYEQLADTHLLQTLLREAEELWPAWPARVPAMDAWLERGREVARRLPLHREALRALEARARPHPGRAGGGFEDVRDQWRHDVLAPFVEALDGFADPRNARRSLREVELRKELASTIHARSVEAGRESWERAARAVAEDPRTRGLRLLPEMGLVPLGPDPASGLQEFCDVQTGDPVRRDPATGRIHLQEETGLVLVLLPAGTLRMGSQGRDPTEANYVPDADRSEGPVHEVRLAPFLLSKYEMTWAQWRRLAGEPPGGTEGPAPARSAPPVTPLHPVTSVSWERCVAVLGRAGLELPTEAQWEYACRAGTGTRFWTGEDLASLSDAAHHADRSSPGPGVGPLFHPVPVARLRPNPFGLHDVCGNVQEWCRDVPGRYDLFPHRAGDGLLETPEGPGKAVRGSSFRSPSVRARSSWRELRDPRSAHDFIGVRPARRIEKE